MPRRGENSYKPSVLSDARPAWAYGFPQHKGTTIISMKESIERSREFLDALKKAKDKNPDCIVRPKVTMKNKGTAAYKGTFPTVEAARNSDKVICLIPGNDGHIYEMHKTEQGEFIAPKHKIIDFQAVAAGFTPALPLIPLSLMRQIIAFFRSFMAEHGQEYEALVLIYWDKWKEESFSGRLHLLFTKSYLERAF